MIDPAPKTADAVLTLIEEEILASADDDILAGAGAAALAARARTIVEGRVRQQAGCQMRSLRVWPRRDRRAPAFDQSRNTKRLMVNRVLVASATARALVEPDRLATMAEDELDLLLARLRTLGLVMDESDD